MKVPIFAFIFAASALAPALSALTGEVAMPCLAAPSGLEKNQFMILVSHRMFVDLKAYPTNDFFAILDNGVNMSLGLRYMILKGWEVSLGYISYGREKQLATSYTFPFLKNFKARAEIQFFSLTAPDPPFVRRNFFYLLTAQSPAVWNRLIFCLDIGWDGYNANPGLAAGLNFYPLEKLCLTAEIVPPLKTGPASAAASHACFTAGVKLIVGGHQFLFYVSNTYEQGERRAMLGTDNTGLYFGFTILRRLAF